jgi:hypothetical protein
MRTTIDIPDPVYRQLKATAALRGCSVREIILRVVERELAAAAPKKGRIKLPLIESDRPGSLHLTNADINEILFP